jgi:hypothetical protein
VGDRRQENLKDKRMNIERWKSQKSRSEGEIRIWALEPNTGY